MVWYYGGIIYLDLATSVSSKNWREVVQRGAEEMEENFLKLPDESYGKDETRFGA
jgi:hypothetical protein